MARLARGPPYHSTPALLKTGRSRSSCGLQPDPLFGGHDQMAWDHPRDTAVRSSHASRISAGEPGAAPATCGVEGAPATPTTDRDGSNLLGSAVEAVDELAAFGAGRPAADRSWLAPARVSTLLDVEESTAGWPVRDQCGPLEKDFRVKPELWTSEKWSLRLARRGKTRMPSAWLAQFDASALTMLS